ncbi:MAG: 2-(1,2-epoxy-1,2-dihydrophenyl)acetyl-CoA isomerase [Chloroflexi bacterium]|nr:MAG: 2-(1,2-epoxy-1,2-dihydrophenyl)acetyl-CoA isomerase [Chloroflexota bacterium]
MAENTVIVAKEGHVAILTLNRPETLNAWNRAMEREALAALEDIGADAEVRVVILTGAGRGFSSGADVSRLARGAEGSGKDRAGPGAGFARWPGLVKFAHDLRELPQPVIGAINGVAAGAGVSVALACDIRIASDQARFSFVFVKRGLVPDSGATYFLPRLVGTARACELMLTGDYIDAHEAERLGIVNRVVPHDALMSESMALAARIASNPPMTIAAIKAAIHKGAVEPDLARQMDLEVYLNGIVVSSQDFKEAVKAYLEKREPHFIGR